MSAARRRPPTLPRRLTGDSPKGAQLREILEGLLSRAAARQRPALRARAGRALRRGAHDRARRARPPDRGRPGLPDPGPRHLRGRAARGPGHGADLVHRGHARPRGRAQLSPARARGASGRRAGWRGGWSCARRRRCVRVDRLRAGRRRAAGGRAGHAAAGALPRGRDRRPGRPRRCSSCSRSAGARARPRPTSASWPWRSRPPDAGLLGRPGRPPRAALRVAGPRRRAGVALYFAVSLFRGDRYEIELRQERPS